MTDAGRRIIEGLEAAIAGDLSAVTINGQRWVRAERPSVVRDAHFRDFLLCRGVEEHDKCGECGGLGVKSYSSTATWRGGIGGQAFTNGVCDKCWGSGSRSKPWPSHRLFLGYLAGLEEAARIAEEHSAYPEDDYTGGKSDASEEISTAIRARIAELRKEPAK